MKIVVCIKQVPFSSNVKIDPATKRLIRDGVESIINPYDLYALELACSIKEKNNAEVIALCMGPGSAIKSLTEALAFGADKSILLTDRTFAGSDTWVTSYILSQAIKTIGNVDLVLTGKQAIDGDTAQVGPGIAAHLNIGQATNVIEVYDVNQTNIKLKRKYENGFDSIISEYPVVIATEKNINQPRVPKINNWMNSIDKEITIWTLDNLTLDKSKLGLKGSPTKVVKTSPPDHRDKETLVVKDKNGGTALHMYIEMKKRAIL